MHRLQTLNCLLHFWTKRFQMKNIPDPCSSAEYLIAHTLQRKTLHNVDLQKTLTKSQIMHIEKLCRMRLERMPVQYIIGEWDFLDMTLRMKSPVLIPRPETEELALLCIAQMEELTGAKTFLEIGSGSGAISLAILKHFKHLQGVAVDINPTACLLTRENAELIGVSDRLHIIEGDVCDGKVMDDLRDVSPYCLVVSNPPYITTMEMEDLQPEVFSYEDHQALHGGTDGLHLIKEIIIQSGSLLQHPGHVWLEVGPSHPPMVEAFANGSSTWSNSLRRLKFGKSVFDMYGKNRFCHLVTSSSI